MNMPPQPATDPSLRAEIAELRARLEEAQDTLRAIRAGEVDAPVVTEDTGLHICTLQGLDAEQSRLRCAMRQVSDAVVTTDREDRITFLNPAAEEQYRVRAADMLGRKVTELYTSQWLSPEAEATAWGALEERSHWRGEKLHCTHDGRVLPVEARMAILHDPETGERAGLIVAIRDITERQQLEQEKAQALQLLDALLTCAPVGFVFLDRDLRFVRINGRLAEINGLPVAAHLGKRVAEIFPTLEPKLRDVTERILATGLPVLDHEFSGATAREAGVTRDWKENWFPVHDSRGAIIGFGGVVEEITERKRGEKALRHDEQRFRGIFDSAFQFIGLTTPEGTLLEANQTALDAGGLRAENVIGKPFWECDWWTLSERTGRELRAAMGRAAAGEVVRYDVEVRGSEGQVITIDFSIKPIRDEAGRVVLLIPEGRDITDLKRAEENLRLTKNQFELAVKASTVVLWQQDLDLRFTWIYNPVAGFDGVDAVGKRDADLLEHATDVAGIESLKREVIRSGVGMHKEFSPRIQGVVRSFDLLMEPLRDAAGNITGLTGAAIDITERKRARDALLQSRERILMASEAAQMGFWSWQPDEDSVVWENDYPFRIIGVPLGSPPVNAARFVAEFLHPDDAPVFEQAVARAVQAGEPFAFMGRIRRPDGVARWVEFTGKLDVEESGRAPRIIGTVQDITARKEAEEALRVSEARLSGILRQSPAGIVQTDAAGRMTLVNPRWCEMFGYTEAELLGRNITDITHPSSAASTAAAFGRLVAGGPDFQIEESYSRKDGSVLSAQSNVVAIRSPDGEFLGLIAVALDISERLRSDAELHRLAAKMSETDHRKDVFLATLAHELRNPLAPMRNGLQFMKLAKNDGVATEKVRAMMDRQLTQLVRLVDDLLDVSRITQGKVELRVERIDLKPVLAAALEASRPAIDEAGHELTVVVPDVPIFVDGDAARLAQAISNLLNNSSKYTRRGGRIGMTVWRENGTAVVAVKDDGIGIPPAMLDRVFELFIQVDRALEKTTGGLGIGLSLVKGLVEMHGGTVDARSDGEGMGSEFVVRLPVATSIVDGPEREGGQSVEVVLSAPRRILVVDDNVDAADSLGQLLEMSGNEVRTANDGEAGIAAAAQFRPDVVLMDIGMPKLNGYDVARRIRQHPWGRSMVLVALTGWGQDEDRKKSSDAGFDHHLVKPVEMDTLIKLMSSVKRPGDLYGSASAAALPSVAGP